MMLYIVNGVIGQNDRAILIHCVPNSTAARNIKRQQVEFQEETNKSTVKAGDLIHTSQKLIDQAYVCMHTFK